jgi:anaerobic selenocysteine-containing dehydrogenase
MSLYDPARPQKPLIRTNPQKGIGVDPQWREASWDEALDRVSARLATVMADDPRKLVILRGVGEPDWVGTCVDAFAKSVGTPNFAGGPFFATHVDACYLINGTMHVEIDVPRCRYLLLFGAQRGGAVNPRHARGKRYRRGAQPGHEAGRDRSDLQSHGLQGGRMGADSPRHGWRAGAVDDPRAGQ